MVEDIEKVLAEDAGCFSRKNKSLLKNSTGSVYPLGSLLSFSLSFSVLLS
jgi:hypothetical protein